MLAMCDDNTYSGEDINWTRYDYIWNNQEDRYDLVLKESAKARKKTMLKMTAGTDKKPVTKTGVSYQEMAKNHGVYEVSDEDHPYVRLISSDFGVLYIETDYPQTVMKADRDDWKNNKFVKSSEQITITFSNEEDDDD